MKETKNDEMKTPILQNENIYSHGPAIDEPVAMTINNSTYFYIPDIQGTIRAIVAENGSVMAEYTYDAWGSLIAHDGPLSEKNDYLYTGREYDWQTGIYYYRARYYNPEIGRFLSRDPAGMVDGPNMYVYVKNEPVNKNDPLGMWACCLQWGWKTVPTLDFSGFKACVGAAVGTPGFGMAVAQNAIFCAGACSPFLILSVPPLLGFVACMGVCMGPSEAVAISIISVCASKNVYFISKYICINPCPGGGGGAPVPGPRPPIVGPIPMRHQKGWGL